MLMRHYKLWTLLQATLHYFLVSLNTLVLLAYVHIPKKQNISNNKQNTVYLLLSLIHKLKDFTRLIKLSEGMCFGLIPIEISNHSWSILWKILEIPDPFWGVVQRNSSDTLHSAWYRTSLRPISVEMKSNRNIPLEDLAHQVYGPLSLSLSVSIPCLISYIPTVHSNLFKNNLKTWISYTLGYQ